MPKHFRSMLAAGALLALSGCLGLGGKVPDTLITLTPSATAAAGATASGNAATAIVLSAFEAPQKLDVTRVPVQVSDTEIAYLKDAVWNEKPARLLARLIGETIRARSGRLVIDGDDPGALAEARDRAPCANSAMTRARARWCLCSMSRAPARAPA
jgi:cholesterol transport system auxiliary component